MTEKSIIRLHAAIALAALLGVHSATIAVQAEAPAGFPRSAEQAGAAAPPAPVRDMYWDELSPRGWDARDTLRRWAVSGSDKDAATIRSTLAGIRGEWDRAPAIHVNMLPRTPVRLIAYAVPLKDWKVANRTVVLSPYTIVPTLRDGDGNITVMPPANQMVLVTLDRPIPASEIRHPIWVTGKITLKPVSTPHGRVAYRMENATWQPYPDDKRPFVQYQWPR